MRAPNSRRGILYRSFVSISHFRHSGMNPPRNLSHRLAHHPNQRNPTERLDESVVEIACVLALCSPVSLWRRAGADPNESGFRVESLPCFYDEYDGRPGFRLSPGSRGRSVFQGPVTRL